MVDFDSPEEVEKRKSQEDPIVMYLIVRESLNMGVGKIAAQCAHASQMLAFKYTNAVGWTEALDFDYPPEEEIFSEWLKGSFRKVVLKADDKEWEKLKKEYEGNKFVVHVIDAGLTEVPSGSETVIGLWPMKKSQAPKVVKKLQVLK